MSDEMSELFRSSAHAMLYERDGDEPPEGEYIVATGAVGQDGTLVIEGLDDGEYWAEVDGQPPMAVRAKAGKVTRVSETSARRLARPTIDGDTMEDIPEDRERADTLVHGDPKSGEAPLASPARDIVTGPRTSANTRVKGAAEKVGEAAKREKQS